jgi:transcriptional regulator with XRE-family HTH domain
VATLNDTGPRRQRAPNPVPLRRLGPRLARALAPVLRESRQAQRLSQEALAGSLGIDRSTLATLELSLRGTTLAMFVLLAQGVQVPPGELLTRVIARLEAEEA